MMKDQNLLPEPLKGMPMMKQTETPTENRVNPDELQQRIKDLNMVFDVVRVVDPSAQHQIIYHGDGTAKLAKEYCFCLWNRNERCANCISARTLATRRKTTKFEFTDDHTYLVASTYLEVDQRPCVLECILELNDATLLGAYGKSEFIARITRYNNQLFNDSLTGVRNRRYYDQQISGLTVQAAAMLDIDHFKTINDTWRHKAGDAALRTVARAIGSCVRKSDILLRYGGDEFVIAFSEIPQAVFAHKLQAICTAVEKAVVPDFPDIHLTISVGGAYGKGQLKERLEAADEALYEAKRRRNQVVVK